jgi:glycosyltransferase involved in cell wall biosynthesis
VIKIVNDIAIAIPTYNSAQFIEKTIQSLPLDSALNIFCCDDASADESEKIAKEQFKGRKARLFWLGNAKNLGPTGNIKKLYSHASANSKYVLLLGHDDLLGLKDINPIQEFLNKHSEVSMASCVIAYFKEKESDYYRVAIPPNLRWLGKYAFCLLAHHNTVASPGSVVRSSQFRSEYLGESTRHTQDYCLALHMSLVGSIVSYSQNFVFYRQSEESLSKSSSYLTAHLEWYNFMLKLIESDLFINFIDSLTSLQRCIFRNLIYFFGWEKPYCIHLREIEFQIAKAFNREKKARTITYDGECDDRWKQVMSREADRKQGNLSVTSRLILESPAMRKLSINLSTATFFTKRVVRSFQYRIQFELLGELKRRRVRSKI